MRAGLTYYSSGMVGGYSNNGFEADIPKTLFSNTNIFGNLRVPNKADVSYDDSTRITGYKYFVRTQWSSVAKLTIINESGVSAAMGGKDELVEWSIRPVILIKTGTLVKSGAGSTEYPYKLCGINYD